jgi:glutathione S-transferase
MSMSIHIWGRLSSLNVRKVVWAAQEVGVAFERTDAGMAFGINKTPDYLRKNPNALVPLLEDGDFSLWESNVIVRYLCAKYAMGSYYPSDLCERFDAERWMDWQQTTFNPAGRDAFLQLLRIAPEQRNAELVRRSVAATEPLLAVLDAHLTQREYVGGPHFGMADIPLGCEMHRWWGIGEAQFAACGVNRRALSDFPQVQRWYTQILERPATRGVLDLSLS